MTPTLSSASLFSTRATLLKIEFLCHSIFKIFYWILMSLKFKKKLHSLLRPYTNFLSLWHHPSYPLPHLFCLSYCHFISLFFLEQARSFPPQKFFTHCSFCLDYSPSSCTYGFLLCLLKLLCRFSAKILLLPNFLPFFLALFSPQH